MNSKPHKNQVVLVLPENQGKGIIGLVTSTHRSYFEIVGIAFEVFGAFSSSALQPSGREYKEIMNDHKFLSGQEMISEMLRIFEQCDSREKGIFTNNLVRISALIGKHIISVEGNEENTFFAEYLKASERLKVAISEDVLAMILNPKQMVDDHEMARNLRTLDFLGVDTTTYVRGYHSRKNMEKSLFEVRKKQKTD